MPRNATRPNPRLVGILDGQVPEVHAPLIEVAHSVPDGRSAEASPASQMGDAGPPVSTERVRELVGPLIHVPFVVKKVPCTFPRTD